MKSITIIRLIILSLVLVGSTELASAQTAPGIIRYNLGYIEIDNPNGTLEQANAMTYKVYIDTRVFTIPAICQSKTEESPTRICTMALPELNIGMNILQVTITDSTGIESARSNPLLVYNTIITKEVMQSTVVKCVPSTYEVARITDATKLLGIINSIAKTVTNILGTSNAIYIFSCTVQE
jgi:hypothetical protein